MLMQTTGVDVVANVKGFGYRRNKSELMHNLSILFSERLSRLLKRRCLLHQPRNPSLRLKQVSPYVDAWFRRVDKVI